MKLDRQFRRLAVALASAIATACAIGAGAVWAMQQGSPTQFCLDTDRCSPAFVERTETGVHFDGVIDAESVARASAELRSGDTLTITSIGGDPTASLTLGELVVERGIKVVVVSSCSSVCALHVFLPAGRKEVRRGGWVRFRDSALFRRDLADKLRHHYGAQERAFLSEVADREAGLYGRAGVDSAFLVCVRDVQFSAWDRAGQRTSQGVRPHVAPEVSDSAIFSREALTAYGVRGLGDYQGFPRTEEDRDFVGGIGTAAAVWIDGRGKPCGSYPRR